MTESNPKIEALLQLLGSQAAEKAMVDILASLTTDEKKSVALELVRRWTPSELASGSYGGGMTELGRELQKILQEALDERRDELKALMLAKVDESKAAWVATMVKRALQ